MNTTTRHVFAAATLLAVGLGVAACGDETVADPGTVPAHQARIYPPVFVPPATADEPGRVSADAAERRAKADQERQDRASTARWDRSSHEETRIKVVRNARP